MSRNRRDDFSASVKRVVGERCSFLCSNPECGQPTLGPHEEDERSINFGVAAHICAAAPGGKRYDQRQSARTRKGAANAIWLCQRCAKIIDSDDRRHTVSKLKAWKKQAESLAGNLEMMPMPPEITFVSRNGLNLQLSRPPLTEEQARLYRDHVCLIENKGDRPLYELRVRIQLPEEVVLQQGINLTWPDAARANCYPEMMNYSIDPGTEFTQTKKLPDFAHVLIVTVSVLPAWEKVKIEFRTQPRTEKGCVQQAELHAMGEHAFFFVDTFWQWEWQGRRRKDHIKDVLRYHPDRTMTIWAEHTHTRFTMELMAPLFGTLRSQPGKPVGFSVWPNA